VLGLLAAALFIALNGFFVAAEFALVKVSTTLSHSRKEREHDPRFERAQAVVARLDRYLSVTQFGITLASLGLGWVGEPAIESQIDELARLVFREEPGQLVHAALVVVAFGILTFGHVLFGELVPKLVAIQRSEQVVFGSARFLHVIYVMFQPLLWGLERATRFILRRMGMNADAVTEGSLSEDELVGILAASAARSPGGKRRADLFERVARFSDRTARHAMVPRVDVFTLAVSATGAEATRQLRTHQYSRVILTKNRSVDDIAGYLYAKDFLLDPNSEQLESLEPVKREVLFVPETQSLIDVLGDMQKSQIPIAVVVDEYGGTSGIVTMEDLLEEIVGEIRDELDVEAARVVKVPNEDNVWEVDARATVDEVRHLGVPVAEEEADETLGALVLERLGRIPRIGDHVQLGAYCTAEIASVSRRRVLRVRLRFAPAPDRRSSPKLGG